jgi:hypothetical protein
MKAGSGFKTSGGHATKILQTDLAANERLSPTIGQGWKTTGRFL